MREILFKAKRKIGETARKTNGGWKATSHMRLMEYAFSIGKNAVPCV